MSTSPWDEGHANGLAGHPAPSPSEFKARGYRYPQAVLFLFGREQARGRVYPPHFRAKLEWLLREPSKLDAFVLAIDGMAHDEPDPLAKIAAFGLSTFNSEEEWEEGFARRHGHRPHSQLAHRHLPPLPEPPPLRPAKRI